MTNIRELIREKFGYVKDVPSISDMHKDKNEDSLAKGENPAQHPLEKYRKEVKALLNATTTEEDGKVEDVLDFEALKRLSNKHAFAPAFISSLNTIELELKKDSPDREVVNSNWEIARDSVPYWVFGLVSKKREELPELEKKALTNLQEIIDEFNKKAEKDGKDKSKDTEHASRDTAAKDNLDAARKKADMDTEAGSEKKLKQKPENELGTEKKKEGSLEQAKKDIEEPKEENKLGEMGSEINKENEKK